MMNRCYEKMSANWSWKAILFLVVSWLTGCFQVASAQNGVLSWKNEDTLHGKLVDFRDGHFVWSSNLFSRPLEVSRDVISEIRFQKEPNETPRKGVGDYVLLTEGRNQFQGQLVGLDQKNIHFKHSVFGKVVFDRNQVRSIRNLANSKEVFSLQNHFHLLKYPFGGSNNVSRNEDNFVTCNGKPTSFGNKLALPETVRMDVKIKSRNGFRFVMGFGYPTGRSSVEEILRVETWEDSLVLIHEDGFEPIFESIPDTQEELEFSLFWDQKNKKVLAIDSHDNVILDSPVVVKRRNAKPGFFFRTSSKLTIEHIGVYQSTEKETKANSGFLFGVNGRQAPVSSPKQVRTFDGEYWTVVDDEGKEQKIDQKDFQSVYLQEDSDRNVKSPLGTDLFRFRDHSSLKGKLSKVQGEMALVQVAGVDSSLKFPINELRRIVVGNGPESINLSRPNPQVFQRLESGGRQLLGTLTGGSGGIGDVLRWKAVGARESLPLGKDDFRLELTPTNGKSSEKGKFQDVLYFVNRDIVPCRVLKFGKDSLTIETFSGKRILDSKEIHAVELGRDLSFQFANFSGGQWKITSTDAKANQVGKSFLTIRGPIRFSHPNLSECRRLAFDVTWKGNGILEASLFERNQRVRGGGSHFSIRMTGDRLEFLLVDRFQVVARKVIKSKNRRVRMLVEFRENEALYSLNNQLVIRTTNRFNRKINCAAQFSVLQTDGPLNISLVNFMISTVTSALSPSEVDAERKKHLLTIPRFRESDPSTHILVAQNGDLLRGRLDKMDEKQVYFRSQEQEFRFDRKVLSSIVWMIPKEKKSTGSEVAKTEKKCKSRSAQKVQVLLTGGKRITMDVLSFDNRILQGVNRLLGKCSVPIDQVEEIRQGASASQAVDFPYSDWLTVDAQKPKIRQPKKGPDGNPAASPKVSPLVGTVPMPFELMLLNGKKFRLADFRGKVVVLDFWATWCGPCVQSMPEMIAATGSFSKDDVQFVAVNLAEKAEKVSPFIKNSNWKMDVALDKDGRVSKAFGASAIPHTVIIAPDGKIQFVKTGSSAGLQKLITKEIQKALKK